MSIYHGSDHISYIDSYYSNTGSISDTNFSYTLDIPVNNNFTHVAVLACQIPKSWYNFDVGQNSFTLKEGSNSTTILVTIGNYTIFTLCSTLSSILTSSSPGGFTYTVSKSSITGPDTGLLYFSVSGNGGVQPSFLFATQCFIQLGFESNSTNTFVANSLTSVNCISLSPVSSVFIKSNICGSTDTVLQEIYSAVPDNSYIQWINPNVDVYSKPLANKTSNTFNFTCNDFLSNVLNSHGLSIRMSLYFFQKNDTSEIHRQELAIRQLERLHNIRKTISDSLPQQFF